MKIMKKVKILPRTIVEDYDNAIARAEQINLDIRKRVDYILKYILGYNLRSWDFLGNEEALGTGMPEYDWMRLELTLKKWDNNRVYLIVNGKKICLSDDGIPVRWLYSDFEEEVKIGRKLFREWSTKELRKEKGHRDSIKKKLTDEEIEYIRNHM